MYRYGDGTPFPLDENFIETLTSAVESCTNAFDPIAQLDDRRERAKDARREGEREGAKLEDLERALTGTLSPHVPADKKPTGVTGTVAQKIAAAAKAAIVEAKRQIETRIQALEAQAGPKTVSDQVLKALNPFFDEHQLPKSVWIMSWDVRGKEPGADAVATAGRISAMFTLAPDPYRQPIKVDSLSPGVVVHMMKKGVFGKAKPAPIDLGNYVVVAFERSTNEQVITLRESSNKIAAGLRFAIAADGATWTSISAAGDAEGDANPLDSEDIAPIKQLCERANSTLKDLINRRTLVDITLGGKSISDLDEPRIVPLEILSQLTPLARTIRERSRVSGELVLKRDIGDGRREELFVPRATLSHQFARLPDDYRKPFEDMGISGEETQPSISLPVRPPARPSSPPPTPHDEKTVEVKK
ncbi:MAG: hypothetical protein H0V17_27020 [Deltaproteobacteria bacterium]|nr:hypothetical protein [Deltaproteobacteria bacterium]